MKADERKRLEENELAHGVTALMDRARSGRLWNYRILGLVLAVVIVGGVWWYAVHESRKANSRMWAVWADLERSPSPSGLEEFANSNKDTVPARLARLEAARIQLGPDGIAQLRQRDQATRNKGIENIEKAREELTRLADEFKGDPTLQATCLLDAAEAELALVGIPKGAAGLGDKGTVQAAADLYRKAAAAVGENTPVGEQARKKAEALEAKAQTVEQVGDRLNNLLSPPPSFNGTPGAGPKPPEGPIPAPKPPETPKPGEGPKAPDKPLNPPPAAAAGVTGGVISGAPANPPPPAPNKK